MKFKLYGKIIERTAHRAKRKDGTTYDLYSLIIEEPGKYPQKFKVSSKDASMFGQKDGLFAIGKFVNVEGFVNGSVRELTGKDGKPFKSYNVYLTITMLESAGEPSASAPEESESESTDDFPY